MPFRDSALKIVQIFINLLFGANKQYVTNVNRFFSEYSKPQDARERRVSRPADFDHLFAGNIDDHFRIGIAVAKKALKLYVDFYTADILIASPLGLKTAIGADGESSYDFDFLSSIEILILDQCDVFLMQNWSHILHIMQHMNKIPVQSHDTDFSRIRLWLIDGMAKFYRQTVILSHSASPHIKVGLLY